MAHKSKPTTKGMPFWPEHLGQKMGSGQDNVVYRLVGDHEKPQLRPPLGKVLKINHDTVSEHRTRDMDERKAAEAGVQYKKNKYEILRLFLGDFVPNSSFVLGTVTEGNKTRYAEYTIQDEVPRVSLHQLTDAQRHEPRLHEGIINLMHRLRYMYSVLGEANARSAHGFALDGRLDLGGVSNQVRSEDMDHNFDDHDAQRVIDENRSPNLLVDPTTMQLYCVDFDQGQWNASMDEAKSMVESIVRRDAERGLGATSDDVTSNVQGTLFNS
jgi:hypothetical protein